MKQDHLIDRSLDMRTILKAAEQSAIEGGHTSHSLTLPVVNTDRVVGTITGAEVVANNMVLMVCQTIPFRVNLRWVGGAEPRSFLS